MRESHRYKQRTSSTYVFNATEVLEALGRAFNLKGWTDADSTRRTFTFDVDTNELTVTIDYDEPSPDTSLSPQENQS